MRNTWSEAWPRVAFSTLIATMALAADSATAQAVSTRPCRAIEGPQYLGTLDRSKTSVIVFIHGVLSSAASAWSQDQENSWPCLLRGEPAFSNSNIYLYGYETSLRDENPSIEKVARQLLVDLNHDDVLNHAHVTIVAHSMGGLVTARMLLAMNASKPEVRQKLNRIKLVSFFGTPATGADIANIASQISYSVQFEEMKRVQGQQPLIDEWARVSWPFAWYCLAEGKNTGWSWGFGTLVVPKESATALCRQRPAQSIETLERFDHISMVKPATLQDPPHRYFRRFFMSCVNDALPKTYPDSEANKDDGRAMIRTLDKLRADLSATTDAARDAQVTRVQDALYQSGSKSERYVLPLNAPQASLLPTAFERLASRAFALELIKLFDGNPNELQQTWVGRLAHLDKFLPDGQLTELRREWTSAGYAQDSDFVLTLKPRPNGEQVVLLGAVQEMAGVRAGRIRGWLILPARPKLCV
jgi:pimeloyl-ACP methyl ester carboxylesterase